MVREIKRIYYYALGLCAVWTMIIAGLSYYEITHMNNDMHDHARSEARASFNKDQAFRYWATGHGGIYVPQTETTPPNLNLSHIPERDIETPSGKKLTLMNPAYMLRQLMEEYTTRYGIRGHITSLKPIRPENLPDEWEILALKSFETGAEEVSAFTDLEGEPYLRLMRPMYVSPGCLKCHAHQGYKTGDVRGGVSISVPMKTYLADLKEDAGKITTGVGLVWIIGLLGISLSVNRIKKQVVARIESDKKRHELEPQYQDLYENAPDMYVSVDAETAKIKNCNRTLLDNTGYKRSEVIDHKIFEMYHPDCMDDVHKSFETFIKNGRIKDAELQLKRKDGSKLEVSLNVVAVRDEDGKILHSRSTWRDITGHKKTEAELARHREHLEELIKERTRELEKKTETLGKVNQTMLGREMRVIELKKEVNSLAEKLKLDPPYDAFWD